MPTASVCVADFCKLMFNPNLSVRWTSLWFLNQIRGGQKSLSPFPPYFSSFLWLPGWLVRLLLWNVVWDKRSGDPETQWPPGEASLSFSLLSHYLSTPLPPPPAPILFSLFLHLMPDFSCALSLFSLCQPAVVWCRPRYSCLALYLYS